MEEWEAMPETLKGLMKFYVEKCISNIMEQFGNSSFALNELTGILFILDIMPSLSSVVVIVVAGDNSSCQTSV